jgi:hypothetical protein
MRGGLQNAGGGCAAALGNSVSGIVTPVGYSFTDGTTTFDNTSSTAYGGGAIIPANVGFGFTTDATGAITGWYFNLLLNANSTWSMQSSLAGGNSLDRAQNGLIGPAEVSNDPGTWTLFGAGALLLVLAGADRRRREIGAGA